VLLYGIKIIGLSCLEENAFESRVIVEIHIRHIGGCGIGYGG
jgi:hypothetical protein